MEPAPGDALVLSHLELTGALRHFPHVDPQLPEAILPEHRATVIDYISRHVVMTPV